MRNRFPCAVAFAASALLIPAVSHAQTAPPPGPNRPVIVSGPFVAAAPFVFREGAAISGVAQGGRRPFVTDAVQAQIVAGTWQPPKAGDTVRLPSGDTRTWEAVRADDNGAFTGRAFQSGYFYASVNSPDERAALLLARGNNAVYVNGELRMGNPYGYEYGRIPVKLKRGVNHFLFVTGRGELTARLLPVNAGQTLLLNTDDPTLPDVLVGETGPMWGAVVVVNASDKPLARLILQSYGEGKGDRSARTLKTPLPLIPPWSSRKVGFRFTAPPGAAAGNAEMGLTLLPDLPREVWQVIDIGTPPAARLSLRVVKATEPYKRTFVSAIDGSVQYYAVNPAQKPAPDNALILSLHGASVEALGQAQAYGPKDGATLIAPTNRRPFGFDWEDWGRLDALEVLEQAKKAYPHDPARVSLTGHSMGGHGSWSIGSLYPDKWAAIGPSAGWISFTTYAGASANAAPPNLTGPAMLVARASLASDTLARGENLLLNPVYIVHGDADDNVPVTEARTMHRFLTDFFGSRVQYHEEPGAGHWWDKSPEPGADCVDWKPMWDLFQTARIKSPDPHTLHFRTPDPAVSATCFYVRVEQQERMGEMSDVRVFYDKAAQAVRGTTGNVRRLTLLRAGLPGHAPVRFIHLDDQSVPVLAKEPGDVSLVRVKGKWQVTPPVPASEKNPLRGSGFKTAFRNRWVLLYGTQGTLEENAWAFARARYDAEAFWYRGNATPDVLPDTAYTDRAGDKFAGRNVILYGNRDTNRAWRDLLGASPVQVARGKITVGSETRTGDNLMCLFLRPRPGSDTALVGAVTGTGMPGLRLTDRLPVFVSGVQYPDWVVADTSVLADTTKGIVGAGYFGNDWKLDAAQTAWRR